MRYRLGLDLGTNSIGWCVLELDDKGNAKALSDAGCRIFSDGRNPKDKTSLAVARRTARSARRRRDRYLRRRNKLLRVLTEFGLMPADPEERTQVAALDPYELRAIALDRAIPLHHIGRAIFHLNQRRGFKSNRRTDGDSEDDAGKIREGVGRLRAGMAERQARTLGEFLYRLRSEGQSVRARLRPQPSTDGKVAMAYELYPERAMVLEEFEAIWRAQAMHYPDVLTQEAHDRIQDILFFQRRLKPVRPGRCTFNTQEERLARAHPLFQRRRIYEQANSLGIVEADQSVRKLDRAQRDAVAKALLNNPKRTFGQLRRLLKLPRDTLFNLESENRKDLKGEETAAVLCKEQHFGAAWRAIPDATQARIVERLIDEQEEETLIAWLAAEHELTVDRATAIARARLPDGHGELGLTATAAILEQLENEVVPYSEAAQRAGYHHSDFRDGEVHDRLAYYGRVLERFVAFGSRDPDDPEETRFGRIANPTVHIALNQLRRVVNALIERYGHPAEIIVELTRDLKLNKKQIDRVNKEIKENTAKAERNRQTLTELGLPDSGENRLRLRLWEELNIADPFDRRCPYSGEPLSRSLLFSAEVEVDHILPFSRTLDNSVANKTVSLRRANREKRNRSPYDAFHGREDWAEILERANRLPRNKRWRFAPDAMERFETEERDFLDRQLVDTQYTSRLARSYLTAVCNPNAVWVTPGRLTELLRRSWGLNSLLPDHNLIERQDRKNRLDHRHHAIDAAVVAVTDRGLLNRVSRAAARAEEQELDRLLADVPDPFPDFRDQLRQRLDALVVSHRPDRGRVDTARRSHGRDATAGRLHNDTAYGFAGPAGAGGVRPVVHRVPLESLKTAGGLEKVRDPQLRTALLAATEGLTGKAFAAALAEVASRPGPFQGLRRVRIVERLKVIPIRDSAGRSYKAYKGDANLRFDVWRLPDGKWRSEVVSMFDAHQGGQTSAVKARHPTARKILRLHKDDLLRIETPQGPVTARVVKFSTSGQLQLAPHQEGGQLKARDADKTDTFKYINASAGGLQKLKARQVRVDALGRVHDPGPRE